MNAEPQANSNRESSPENRRHAIQRRIPWQMLWALADQAIVSVARMATSILIGRYSKEELGLYTLGFTVLTLVISLQEAMVTTPYTIFVARYPKEEQPSFAGHLFLLSKLLTVLAMFGLGIAIGTAYFFSSDPTLIWVLLGLLLILPFGLIKEFSRRWQVAHLKVVDATFIDGFNTVLLLGGLGVLYYFQSLTAFNAFMVIGLAALLATMAWGAKSHHEFKFRWKQFKHTLRSCVHFGKWGAGENVFSVLQYFFGNWFLYFILSKEDVGSYAGCMTIVMLSNPFLLGVTGLLATRSGQAYANEGIPAVRKLVFQYMWYISLVMIAFSCLIFFCGDWLLQLVFKGEITGQAWTISLLSFAMIGLGISYMTACGLRAVNRPETNFYGSLVGLLVTAGLSFSMLNYASPYVSAAAFLAGTTAMAIYRWVLFVKTGPQVESKLRI